MKKIIIILVMAFTSNSFAQQLASKDAAATSLQLNNATFNWTETTYDFGKIKLNVPATHTFTFINKGTTPLVISSVQASCGCTVTEYSKEAIAAGQQGFVKATYNAAKTGTFTKSVTINANTEDAGVHLTIKGEVLAD